MSQRVNGILRDQTITKLLRRRDKLAKILNLSQLLARPRGFEPLTLGLEMRRFVVTNSTELSRFVILQYLFYKVPTKMA